MNQHRLTARAAAFGVAATMMAGGLVASLATTASADGGTFSNVYQCGPNEFTVSLTPTAPLPPSMPAGQNVPRGIPQVRHLLHRSRRHCDRTLCLRSDVGQHVADGLRSSLRDDDDPPDWHKGRTDRRRGRLGRW